uniref:Uncharacterized protein n=1 Tax=Phlebotomus papatasi TaxID=29031 RepID=A0A1B0DFT6_PHLPP
MKKGRKGPQTGYIEIVKFTIYSHVPPHHCRSVKEFACSSKSFMVLFSIKNEEGKCLVSRTYQYRKVMKPMLERKRRARINRCLDELKELMTGALQTVSTLSQSVFDKFCSAYLHRIIGLIL